MINNQSTYGALMTNVIGPCPTRHHDEIPMMGINFEEPEAVPHEYSVVSRG